MTPSEQMIRNALGGEAEPYDYYIDNQQRIGWRRLIANDDRGREAERLVEENWRSFYEAGVPLFVGPTVFELAPGQYSTEGPSIEFEPGNLPEIPEPPPTRSQVITLPGASVLDIVEHCRVGSHNPPPDMDSLIEGIKSMPDGPLKQKFLENLDKFGGSAASDPRSQYDEPWQAVQQALAEVLQITPFAITRANAAGLTARALTRLTPEKADRIGKILFELNSEIMDVAHGELDRRGIEVPMDSRYDDMPDYPAVIAAYFHAIDGFHLWWD